MAERNAITLAAPASSSPLLLPPRLQDPDTIISPQITNVSTGLIAENSKIEHAAPRTPSESRPSRLLFFDPYLMRCLTTCKWNGAAVSGADRQHQIPGMH